ncbi:MAG: radical SAM protein [Clostridia bacterium]|nr:radical SAM protein [Clostridia bacterium]
MDESNSSLKWLEDYRKKGGDPVQEYHELTQFWEFKARDKGVPVSGLFELTPLCNFSCKMCYVHMDANQLKDQKILPTETWKRLMREAFQAGMMFASLSGGECLAYPGFDELYFYLRSLGVEINVLTNAYLLDEKRIQFFKKHQPALIQITLYGWNDDVYERVTGKRVFSAVRDHIKRAVEENLPVRLTVVPNRYLGEDLLETIRVAKDLCKFVSLNNFINTPREETGRSGQRDDAELDLYIRAYKYFEQLLGRETREIREEDLPPCGGSCHECSERGILCGGGRSTFAIDWKGTLLPCPSLSAICAYPLKEGFAAAWAQLNQAANNWPRVPECKGCAYSDACHHCAADMLRFADPGKKPSGLCEQTREMVRQGVKHIPDCE